MVNLTEQEYDKVADSLVYSKQQDTEVRENILTKLYMLQKYNVTMNMFKGSNMRWKSIKTYMTIVRRMYEGKYDRERTTSNIGNGILDFIQGLIDSGTEPLDTVDIDGKEISIDDLMKYELLTKHEAEYIYSSVGPKNNDPDLSVSGTRNRNKSLINTERDTENHVTIVQEYSTNPINKINFQGGKKNVALSYTIPPWIAKLKLKK